ncbi:hypothetical protein [Chitinophaga sp. YIM B06452]|uniref:hypothetical protein n=1 Tax=Chitinophaga sp. YIM B06452 TaxID=3082158 RepID=UPI0031FF23AC
MFTPLLRLFTATGCAALLFTACSSYDPNELLNCENAAFYLSGNGQSNSLKMLSANMLRNQDLKLLAMEAYYKDSVRVLLNLADAGYTTAGLKNDSLHLGDYIFSRRQATASSGKVVLGFKAEKEYQFLTTDSSSITITEIDAATRTVSGSYYVETVNPDATMQGSFSRVCFRSIQ